MSKKREQKKGGRNCSVLGMIITRKGGPMKDRREPRGGNKNEQVEFLSEVIENESEEIGEEDDICDEDPR